MYIPQEDLARFDVTEADLAAGRVTPQFIALLEYEFERREAYYRHAAIGVRNLKTGRWGVMAGLEVYRGIHAADPPQRLRRFHPPRHDDALAEDGAGAAVRAAVIPPFGIA